MAGVLAVLILPVSCSAPDSREQAGSQTAAPPEFTDAQKARIDELTGAKGNYFAAEEVYKVTFPRTEVKMTVDGWAFHPFMGITSWAAFTPLAGGEFMVMGDLAVFEDEVSPVMSAALDNGLEVTALHNHFLYDRPKVMFMHIGGHGGIDALAGAVRKAMDQVAQIRKASPQPASSSSGPPIPARSAINGDPIDNILGVRGSLLNGMYKAVIGRRAKMHGRDVANQMGVNTWAAFAGADDNAIVDGDFAMRESEVQRVLKSLRAANINIVAIHNHMIGDEPRYVFLHYWGRGPAIELARGIRSALDLLGEK